MRLKNTANHLDEPKANIIAIGLFIAMLAIIILAVFGCYFLIEMIMGFF